MKWPFKKKIRRRCVSADSSNLTEISNKIRDILDLDCKIIDIHFTTTPMVRDEFNLNGIFYSALIIYEYEVK